MVVCNRGNRHPNLHRWCAVEAGKEFQIPRSDCKNNLNEEIKERQSKAERLYNVLSKKFLWEKGSVQTRQSGNSEEGGSPYSDLQFGIMDSE